MVLRESAVTPDERDDDQGRLSRRGSSSTTRADLIDGTSKLQLVLSACGNAPNTERELIQATIRQLLLGLDDDEYKALDDEIELLVETKSQLQEQIRELPGAAI